MPTTLPLTDLNELKTILELDPQDRTEDKKLLFLIDYAAVLLQDFLGMPNGFLYKSRTEYYGGSGTQRMTLRTRPVTASPTITVNIDEAGFYGSASGSFASTTALTYGTDFCLDIDQDDSNTSRSGILVRMNDVWPKPSYRQKGYLSPFVGQAFGTIKVVYSAGWTVDGLPANFRLAMNLLVARLRYILPIGMELSSDGYEEKSIGISAEKKDYLLGLVKPLIFARRNWAF